MKVKFEDETPWRFELGAFLEERLLTPDDISEIIMMVKNLPTDADISALVTKKFTLAEIALIDDTAAVVNMATTDYGAGAMEIGGSYYVYLGLTVTGYSGAYLEASLRDHIVTITQDGIRS